jgi:hypothetical protein
VQARALRSGHRPDKRISPLGENDLEAVVLSPQPDLILDSVQELRVVTEAIEHLET